MSRERSAEGSCSKFEEAPRQTRRCCHAKSYCLVMSGCPATSECARSSECPVDEQRHHLPPCPLSNRQQHQKRPSPRCCLKSDEIQNIASNLPEAPKTVSERTQTPLTSLSKPEGTTDRPLTGHRPHVIEKHVPAANGHQTHTSPNGNVVEEVLSWNKGENLIRTILLGQNLFVGASAKEVGEKGRRKARKQLENVPLSFPFPQKR